LLWGYIRFDRGEFLGNVGGALADRHIFPNVAGLFYNYHRASRYVKGYGLQVGVFNRDVPGLVLHQHQGKETQIQNLYKFGCVRIAVNDASPKASFAERGIDADEFILIERYQHFNFL
jgi:hypothetical protein